MLQVLMWDTIDGIVDKNILNQLVSGKVLNMCAKAYKILESNAKVVAWVKEPALVCESCG